MSVDKFLLKLNSLIEEGGDIETMKQIVQENMWGTISIGSTFIPNTNKSILMQAAKFGRLNYCHYFIEIDPLAVKICNKQGYTALHYACFHGHEQIAVALISAGSDIFQVNSHNETPLDSAQSGQHLEIVSKLKEVYDQSSNMNTFPNLRNIINEDHKVLNHPNPNNNIKNHDIESENNSEADYIVVEDGEIIEPIPNQDSTENLKIQKIISKSESLRYKFHVTSTEGDGDKSQIGCTFNCLSTTANPSSNENGLKPASSYSHLKIGRSRGNNVNIIDLSISKFHAVITFHEEIGFALWDCGSKHGSFIGDMKVPNINTYVNDDKKKISKMKNILLDGTEFTLGRISFRVIKELLPTIISKGFQPAVASNSNNQNKRTIHDLNVISEVEYHKKLIAGAYAQKVLEHEYDKKRKREEELALALKKNQMNVEKFLK